ncbi:MAG: hypothetical protein LBS28_04910 [Streptococcaceae bacterium]|jgi:hypothetical protein|nr:hypothetical protein [Streptococcaceae bacterium]
MKAIIYINFKLLKNKFGPLFYLYELILFLLGGGMAYYSQEKVFTSIGPSIRSSLNDQTSLFIYVYFLNAGLFTMMYCFALSVSEKRMEIAKSNKFWGNNALMLYLQSGRSMILYYLYQYLSVILLGFSFLIGYQLYSMFAYQIVITSIIIGLFLFVVSNFLLIQLSNLLMQFVRDSYINVFVIAFVLMLFDRIPLISDEKIRFNQITIIFFVTLIFSSHSFSFCLLPLS